MSTIVSKNVQIGADGTASNNFTAYQPSTPDGTLRIGNGNSGSVTDAITLTSAGNVGIGTSSPGARLAVVTGGNALRVTSSAGQNAAFEFASNGNSVGSTSFFVGQGVSGTASVFQRANLELTFGTNNSERMRITSAGSVGIGTTSPAAKLDVQGDVIFNDPSASLTVKMTSVGGVYNIMDSATGVHSLQFDGGYYSIYDLAASSERMRIDSAGNVGIGNSSPATKLDFGVTSNASQIINLRKNGTSVAGIGVNAEYGVRIAGPSDAAAPVSFGTIYVSDGTSFLERMRIDTAGNVGIGTSSPTQKLSLVGDSTFNGVGSGAQITMADTAGRALAIVAPGSVTNAYIGTTSNHTLNIMTGGSSRLVIDTAGNVGIGNSSPAAKLDVLGGITISRTATYTASFSSSISHESVGTYGTLFQTLSLGTGNFVWRAGSSERLRIDSAGSVGIGTSSPSDKLEIATTGYTGVRITGGNSNSQQVRFYSATQENAAVYSYYNGGSPYFAIYNNGSERMRIDSAGNVGVGITNPNSYAKLAVNGSVGIAGGNLAYFYNSANSNYASIASVDTTGLAFATGATERMRLDSGGRLLVGKTSGTTLLDVAQAFEYKSVSFTAGSNGYITIPNTPAAVMWLAKLVNTANINLNVSYILLTNTRSNAFGGGNNVTVVSSSQGSTGTGGEISGVTFSIYQYGGTSDLALRASATTINGSGTILFSARMIQI